MLWIAVAYASSEDAQVRYLSALAAWQAGDLDSAGTRVAEALAADPTLAEARLLSAMVRTRRKDEAALADLAALATDPSVRDEVRIQAAEVASRYTERSRRDEVTLGVGWGLGFEERATTWTPEGRVGVNVEVPLVKAFRLRFDFDWDPVSTVNLSISGPQVFAGAAWSLPLGSGVSALELGAGVGAWRASGVWWRDGAEYLVGGRFFGAVDVRPWRNVGLAAEVGTSVWPTLSAELSGFGQPLELRMMVKLWFGTPPLIRAARSPSPS